MLETERQKTARLEVNMKMSEEDKESRVRDVRTELEMKKQDIARFLYCHVTSQVCNVISDGS